MSLSPRPPTDRDTALPELPEDLSPEACEALDAYAAAVQRGDCPDRQALLNRFPQLAAALDCIEQLEQLARSHDTLDLANDLKDFPDGAAPRDFGKYELLEELGRGGMGVVFKARQKDLDRVVALKMILSGHFVGPEHRLRFQAEARAAAGLRHPSIVSVYEAGEYQGQPYFAMEYVEGSSLAQRLAEGPMEPHAAAAMLREIAAAADYLHRHGILHRDIKPGNILLDPTGRPTLTDFGLAKLLGGDSQQTRSGMIVGTPAYMSPEQAAGKLDEVGPASDIYSLGAVLYEMLTGRPPFKADSALDVLVQVLEQEPASPRSLRRRVPVALELICLRCLEKHPQRRYATAQELAEDLDRFLRGDATEAKPRNLAFRALRWARRRPALAGHLLALGGFYAVELLNFHVWKQVEPVFHGQVTALVVLWVVAALVFQCLLGYSRWAGPARFAWAAVDVGILLAMLRLGSGLQSPLLVALPLLIAASGLWFRVRLVVFTTVLTLLAYVALVWSDVGGAAGSVQLLRSAPQQHVFFSLMLVVLGGMMAYQVHRVRCLSHYYESHRLP